MIDRLRAMKIFVCVADDRSFAQAARRLNLSAPAVTRAIAGLEQLLDTRLFVRTTRVVKLTETGLGYLEDCRRILSEVDEAERTAAGSFSAPAGTLTISTPVLFGRLHVLPILTSFLAKFPAVTGNALFVDRITHLVEEGIDIAVRIGHLADSSYISTRVGTVRQVICGSKSYFRQQGIPRIPDDLKQHRIVASTAGWSSLEWHFGAAIKSAVVVKPALACTTNDAAIAAALSGFGLTRVLSYQVGPEVQAGRLRIVLAEYEEPPLPVHVIYPGGRRISAKVRAFVDHAVERLRANPAIHERLVTQASPDA